MSTRLLVSVRSADEAEEALIGGADIIDVKEPSRGSLGMADPAVWKAVRVRLADRVPVTAALGELVEWEEPPSLLTADLEALWLVKVGLAGCRQRSWQDHWQRLACKSRSPKSGFGWRSWRPEPLRLLDPRLSTLIQPRPGWVAVVYADWRRANAPAPDEVIEFAIAETCPMLLIDIWHKDGSTLLDWFRLGALAGIRRELAANGVGLALAGSLGPREIQRLLPLKPAVIAVRGAACHSGQRHGGVSRDAVRDLADVIHRTKSRSQRAI